MIVILLAAIAFRPIWTPEASHAAPKRSNFWFTTGTQHIIEAMDNITMLGNDCVVTAAVPLAETLTTITFGGLRIRLALPVHKTSLS